jgi:hypothetical protein
LWDERWNSGSFLLGELPVVDLVSLVEADSTLFLRWWSRDALSSLVVAHLPVLWLAVAA